MTDKRELSRMWNVVDQMTTAHSVLRDRYRAWALLLTLTILALSVVATALGFAGEPEVTLIVTASLPTWVGTLSCGIFFLSLVDLQLDWRSKARDHAEAAKALSAFKMELREADARLGAGDPVEIGDDYQATMQGLVEISDRKFLRFKGRHLRKVEVSKRISARPELPVWLHRARLLGEGLGLLQQPAWLAPERGESRSGTSLPPGVDSSLEAMDGVPPEDRAKPDPPHST